MNMWRCEKHGTFGDNGWSCSICGYPIGVRSIEIIGDEMRILKFHVNLYLLSISIYKVIPLESGLQ